MLMFVRDHLLRPCCQPVRRCQPNLNTEGHLLGFWHKAPAARSLCGSTPFRHQRARLHLVRVAPRRMTVPFTGKETVSKKRQHATLTIADNEGGEERSAYDERSNESYGLESIGDIVRGRTGWLTFFAGGLMLAAIVVQHFDSIIEKHVELSFFVPLIMGHGGNTGSQTTCALIRALALRQVSYHNLFQVVWKESMAGCIMGSVLGLTILAMSHVWSAISPEVGMVVAVAIPVISLWSNGLAAFLVLMSDKLQLDPAMTSAPLMTTIVDTTGLIIYFYIADLVIKGDLAALAMKHIH